MSLRDRVDRLEERCKEMEDRIKDEWSLRDALPCDMCGSVLGLRICTEGRSCRVECSVCGVSGPHGRTEFEGWYGRVYHYADRSAAVKEWNSVLVGVSVE